MGNGDCSGLVSCFSSDFNVICRVSYVRMLVVLKQLNLFFL